MRINTHKELRVYQASFEAGMSVFKTSKAFPQEERYSLTDQIRRSSRSVSSNLAEAWRKRRYPKSFVSKLSDAEAEAAETQVWLDYALECEYLNPEVHKELYSKYDSILGMIVRMIQKPEDWSVQK